MTTQLHEFLSQHFTIRVNEKGEQVVRPDNQKYLSTIEFIEHLMDWEKLKQVIKLPTLELFIGMVRAIRKDDNYWIESLSLIFQYKDFINQHLTLSMFVPVKDGRVLEEPKEYQHYLKDGRGIVDPELYKCGVYQRAQSNVLFEGWKVYHNERNFIGINLTDYTSMVFHPSGMVSIQHQEELPTKLKTISDLLPFGVKLRV